MKQLMLVILVVFLMVPGAGSGAEGFSSAVEGLSAIDFPQISLQVRVFSPEPITPTSDMFELFEMETRIATFDVQMTRPSQFAVLVLDRSSSMEPVMGLVKQSATAFVEAISPKIPTSLLSFASDIDFGTDFSKDVKLLTGEITKLRPWGGTALFDALYKACELINAKAGRNDVKTIVCLTDGKDESPRGEPNFSAKKPADIARYATRNRIRIITVGLGTNLDENFLKKIAQFTSGWYLQSPTVQQLTGVFQDITKRILMEQRFAFRYQTPNPKPDGTTRDVVVHSEFKGRKDQGKGSYVAPKTMPKTEIATADPGTTERGKKVTLTFRDFDLSGPDTPYLTGPIIPGPSHPVHGPNGADFLGRSPESADQLLKSSEERMRSEHAANFQRQSDYLDGFLKHLDAMLKGSEEEFSRSNQAEYEQKRIEYRRGIIARRRKEVELHRQECKEEHDASLEADLRELAIQRQEYVDNAEVPDNFRDTIRADRDKKHDEIDARYKGLYEALDKEEDAFQESFDKSRGSHVINETETKTSFSVGNTTEDDEPSASEDAPEDADDSDDDSGSEPRIPDVKIPDINIPKLPGIDD